MPVVHYRYAYDRLYAPWASMACFTSCVTLTISIVITILFCWNTRSFWVLRGEYFEQPQVEFNKMFFFEVDTASASYSYSNIDSVARLIPASRQRIGAFAVEQVDSNQDGHTDEFKFALHMPAEDVQGFTALRGALFFRFALSSRIRLLTQAMVYVQASSSVPAGTVSFVGDLRLGEPLILIPDRDTVTQFNVPVIDPTAASTSAISFDNFVPEYYARNVSVAYNYRPPVWSRYAADGLHVKLLVRVPKDVIFYRPGFWESIKFAWIQLVCIFLVCFIVRGVVHAILFEGRLLATRTVPDPISGKAHRL